MSEASSERGTNIGIESGHGYEIDIHIWNIFPKKKVCFFQMKINGILVS